MTIAREEIFGPVMQLMKSKVLNFISCIAREEIFGPVMQLMKFKTLEDAIERANKTHYGLGAGVCTRDVGTALAVARDLEAGTVWVNCYDNFDHAAPFGGFKESGWGREKGEAALQNYTEVKTVMMPIDPRNGDDAKKRRLS